MKKCLFMLAACAFALASCTHTSTGVHVAGHPYKTDPNCKRTKPLGKFDAICDEPVVGYSGFSDPSGALQSGGGIGGAMGGF